MHAHVPAENLSTEVVVHEPLSSEEDSFAVALVEYGGNPRAAYAAVFGETSDARRQALELAADPRIQARVSELQSKISVNSLISIEGHLMELASIRDMSKNLGMMKAAIEAEKLRGTVAGFYLDKERSPDTGITSEARISKLAHRLMELQRNTVDVVVREVK